MDLIKFENFSCYYKLKKDYVSALEHIDLEVAQGELLVVLGRSGSGKTTLLKCILGQGDYISGSLTVDGIPAEDLRVQQSNMGYIPQQFNLYPHMTVYDNIAFPLRMIHTPQEEVDRRVKELAALLEVDYLLTRKPRQLSGGQLQRIAIARALIKNPVCVLMDEPFANIDPSLHTQMRQLVKKLHKHFGCTIVFVTHDLADAYNLADRVAILEEGKLVAIGTPQALMEKGYLQ